MRWLFPFFLEVFKIFISTYFELMEMEGIIIHNVI